eukprot:5461479-Pleurochrysis_carterae.AAC.3
MSKAAVEYIVSTNEETGVNCELTAKGKVSPPIWDLPGSYFRASRLGDAEKSFDNLSRPSVSGSLEELLNLSRVYGRRAGQRAVMRYATGNVKHSCVGLT